jgi:hypothetical protein
VAVLFQEGSEEKGQEDLRLTPGCLETTGSGSGHRAGAAPVCSASFG